MCSSDLGGGGNEQLFAAQLVAACAVGKAIGPHVIQPFFQDGRGVEPVGRVLQDNDVGLHQCGLFGGNVNAVIGVKVGQAAHAEVAAEVLFQVCQDQAVADGLLQVLVGGDNEDFGHGFFSMLEGGMVRELKSLVCRR